MTLSLLIFLCVRQETKKLKKYKASFRTKVIGIMRHISTTEQFRRYRTCTRHPSYNLLRLNREKHGVSSWKNTDQWECFIFVNLIHKCVKTVKMYIFFQTFFYHFFLPYLSRDCDFTLLIIMYRLIFFYIWYHWLIYQ